MTISCEVVVMYLNNLLSDLYESLVSIVQPGVEDLISCHNAVRKAMAFVGAQSTATIRQDLEVIGR